MSENLSFQESILSVISDNRVEGWGIGVIISDKGLGRGIK